MPLTFRSFCFASTALSLSLAALTAKADVIPLPVGSDLLFTDTANTPKGSFSSVAPAGWTGGTGLIFVDSTSIAGAQAASPVYLTTYGNPSGSVSGNYIEADGNPSYGSSFSRSITGLTPGQQYSLTFYQGASEQVGYPLNGVTLATTNQWIVSLGTQGLSVCIGCGQADPVYGGNDSTYSNSDSTASYVASPLITVPYQGTVGWSYVTVTLTADATTDLLSFLAWGDNGNTVNLPPIAFLGAIDQPAGEGAPPLPEPVSMSLFGVGLAGLGVIARRRRGKRSALN